MKPKSTLYYAIYCEDEEHVFGPFFTEEEADEYAWQYSLRNGVDEAYGGSSTEVVTEEELNKKYPKGVITECPFM